MSLEWGQTRRGGTRYHYYQREEDGEMYLYEPGNLVEQAEAKARARDAADED